MPISHKTAVIPTPPNGRSPSIHPHLHPIPTLRQRNRHLSRSRGWHPAWPLGCARHPHPQLHHRSHPHQHPHLSLLRPPRLRCRHQLRHPPALAPPWPTQPSHIIRPRAANTNVHTRTTCTHAHCHPTSKRRVAVDNGRFRHYHRHPCFHAFHPEKRLKGQSPCHKPITHHNNPIGRNKNHSDIDSISNNNYFWQLLMVYRMARINRINKLSG